MRVSVPISLLLLWSAGLCQETRRLDSTDATKEHPSFEVASVRRSPPPGTPGRTYTMRGGPGTSDPGQIAYRTVTLKTLIAVAYGVKSFQISGPTWLDEERYDIIARVPIDARKHDVPLMWRRLLAESFKVSVHREVQQVPVYVLVIANGGAKLKAATEPGVGAPGGSLTIGPNGAFHLVAKNRSIESLLDVLRTRLDRPLLNGTGLDGKFDFELRVEVEDATMTSATGGFSPVATSLVSASIAASALRAQLGLNLESKRDPTEVIVVDHAERVPAEN